MTAVRRESSRGAMALVIGCATLALAEPAGAGTEPVRPPDPTFEISPFVGYRVGGNFTDTTNNESLIHEDAQRFANRLAAGRETRHQFGLGRQELADVVAAEPDLLLQFCGYLAVAREPALSFLSHRRPQVGPTASIAAPLRKQRALPAPPPP